MTTYRVNAHGVHCPGASGVAQLRVERPTDNEGNYTDSDDAPTTITEAEIAAHQKRCGDFCHLKLHKLLRDGALAVLATPEQITKDTAKSAAEAAAAMGELNKAGKPKDGA